MKIKNLMLILNLILLLTTTGLSQEPSKKSDIPAIPAEYKTKLLKLVVRQQQIKLHEAELQEQYRQAIAAMDQVNAQGMQLEAEILKKLGLPDTKYMTKQEADGDVVIVEKPNQSTAGEKK